MNFLDILFNTDEVTCFSNNLNGTSVKEKPNKEDIFFCINPLHPENDLIPQRDWHAINKPRRADHNVIKFRNFLIELDNMDISKQIEYVTSKIPVTSIVYSGGKSYHFIISLKSELENIQEYRNFWLRLHNLLPAIDKACKNPSRLSRLPGVIRPDTNKLQHLEYLNDRIENNLLENNLPNIITKDSKNLNDFYSLDNNRHKIFFSQSLIEIMHNPDIAILELKLSGRNALFHYIGQRLIEKNIDKSKKMYIIDNMYNNLKNKKNFTKQEAYLAARI